MSNYNAAAIKEPDPMEHIRMKPGMWLGNNPFETAVRELIDNSFDEIVGNHADKVTVILRADSSVEVIDNGRGVPHDYDTKAKKNGIVKSLGTPMAGSKFDNKEGSSGTHGVGASGANAISDIFTVTVWRKGEEYTQAFQRGVPGHYKGTDFDKDAPFTAKKSEDLKPKKAKRGTPKNGTSVRLIIDRTISKDAELDINNVLFRARCSAIMIEGASLDVINEGWPEEVNETLIGSFSDAHGTEELLKFITEYNKIEIPDSLIIQVDGEGMFSTQAGDRQFTYSVAVAPRDPGEVWGFANSVYNPKGGNHISATSRGIGQALEERSKRLRGLGMQKGEAPPEAADFANICLAVVTTVAPGIQFSGQSKEAIESASLGRNLANDLKSKLSLWASSPANTDVVTAWAKIALEYARTKRSIESARARARAKNKSKSLGENLSLPEKLVPCRNTGRGSGAELYICEGDSALGTIRNARDAQVQACFPLKGKPMNVYDMTLAKARKNAEFEAIERILDCGSKEKCDPEKSRYDRIMLASDADPDGANINSLMIVMMLEFFRPLVEAGMLYVTIPPLFAVVQGESKIYCQTEDERDAAIKKLSAKSNKRIDVKRNKGLGEMDDEEFWDTVLDPESRTLRRITIEDAEKISKMSYTLFGGPAVGRREWISEMSHKLDLDSLDLSG